MSIRAIRSAVSGQQEAKDLALQLLVTEGYVAVSDGPRGSRLHALVRPFQAHSD